jgi:hypothetical protein
MSFFVNVPVLVHVHEYGYVHEQACALNCISLEISSSYTTLKGLEVKVNAISLMKNF